MSGDEKEILRTYFKGVRRSSYSKGEVILDAEVEHSEIFYIESGYVKVYAINDQGDLYTHIIYKKGELFPVTWAFAGGIRNVFYEAVTDTVVHHTSRDSFVKFVKGSAEAAYALVTQVSRQFFIYANRVDNLEYRSARERVVYRLLFLASRFGTKRADGIVIELPLTHELIASTINLVRESVSRELEKLDKKGIIYSHNRHIVIKDMDRLNNELREPLNFAIWNILH